MKNAVRIRRVVSRTFAAGCIAGFLSAAPVSAATAADAPLTPSQPAAEATSHGLASWYGEEFAGRTTANGEVFEPVLYTAAHRTYPFGTILDVKNPANGKSVRVRVNDRGPYVADRMIDLSYAAAKEIGIVDSGSGEVDVMVVSVGKGEDEPPAPYTVTLAQTKSAQAIPPSVRQTAEPAQPSPAAVEPQPATEPMQQPATAAPEQTAVGTPVSATAAPAPQPAATMPTQPSSESTSTPSAAAVASQPAAPAPQTADVKIAAEPPPVDFPLPTDLAKPQATTQAAPAPAAPPPAAPAPAPVTVDNVQVVEEHQGMETRRQVGSDGKSIESVSADTGQPLSPAPAAESVDRTPTDAAAAQPHAKRYLVQVGAFGVESNAKALAELLAGFGMQCRIDHDKLYRVRMGPFDSRDEALKMRGELESKGISAMVVGE